MAFSDNDRLQEIFLLIGDKMTVVNKKWWYALGITLIALIPAYYLFKLVFIQAMIGQYAVPQMVYSSVVKQPLQILDKNIFTLSKDTYSGFVKIKNINLEWGVADQGYTAEFKTTGGTVLTRVSGSVFILPASEKLIVFSKFTSPTKPDEIIVSLADSQFIHKPDVSADLELQRVNIQNNFSGLLVSAGVKNLTPFTISRVNLPVSVYDSKNQIVAVSFTYISALQSGETRTFQYVWPSSIAGSVRAEIIPEVNIFDRNIFSTQAGISPFSETGNSGNANQQ
jgi:hypothetical protein